MPSEMRSKKQTGREQNKGDTVLLPEEAWFIDPEETFCERSNELAKMGIVAVLQLSKEDLEILT